MKKAILSQTVRFHFLFPFFSFPSLFAQIGINTTTPTAELEIVTTNSNVGTKALAIVNNSGTVLLTVMADGTLRIPSLQPGGWVTADANGVLQLGTAVPTVGDIKYSFFGSDHQGWIKLDGRAVVGFTATQQAALASLSFITALPNASQVVLLQTGQPTGTNTGSMQRTLTQANLPNITFPSATTSTAGSHTHSSNATGSPGSFGLIYRSLPGQNNNARDTDSGGSGSEPNITGTPGAIVLAANGDHSHTVTVSSGGSGVPIDVTPRAISANVFVYVVL